MNTRTLTLLLLLVTVVTACKKKEPVQDTEIEYSEKQAKIISSVTNGKITSDRLIEIKFIKPVVDKDSLNIELDKDIFTFTPDLKGKAYWSSTNLLVFEPEKPLEYRSSYLGKLNLNALSKSFAKEDIKDLEFKFEVIGPELASFNGEVHLKDRNNPKVLNYSGKISFTIPVEEEALLKALSIKQGGRDYKVFVTKEDEGLNYRFVSEDLIRDDKSRVYTFVVDKKPIDISEEYTEDFEISELGSMKVVNIRKDEENRHPIVQLEFSDEFDFEQQIDGMIRVKGMDDVSLKRMGKMVIIEAPFKFGEQYTIIVGEGIRSRWGTKTEEEYSRTIKFADIKPQVEFASDGIILPSSNEYKLQFYTSNLRRVHIEVKKVYDEGLREFLQTEQLSSVKDRHESFNGSYINRVGVIVHNESFEIGAEKNEWKLNEIDLSNLVKNYNSGLYLIRLNFNPRDMLSRNAEDEFNYIEEFGQIYKPLMFSNIGLTVKQTENDYKVFATDLISCEPLSGVRVMLKAYYRSHDEILSSAVTDNNGEADLHPPRYYSGSYIEARKDDMLSVIKFNEMQWNNSGFDVSGISENFFNTSAFIYTERGVYRPGDLINLSVIARHKQQDYPDNKALTVDLYNPQNKKVYTQTVKESIDGFYNFPFQMKETDPTGNWSARFYIGNKSFSHTVKIETIVPYKLKVKIEPEEERITRSTDVFNFEVVSTYLFGNPAANLEAKVEMEISERNVSFKKFENFTFSHPSYDYRDIQKKLYEGPLDENGKKALNWTVPEFDHVPSGLNMKITATVLEKGGRPNINWINIPIDPYDNYVGLQSPARTYIKAGKDIEIPVILVDKFGKTLPGRKITYRIYQNRENWWWQYDRNRMLRFKTDQNTRLIKEGSLVSRDTHTRIKFLPIEAAEYLIEVIDESGTGHASGIFLRAYAYGRSATGDKNAGTLALSGDKQKYFVGDVAKISFPTPKEGLVLFTVEKEDKVLSGKWYHANGKEDLTIELPVTSNMVPNAYITVSLMQPHSQTVNDRPIRMFGILPLTVEDRESRHDIAISTKEQFRPNEPFEVDIQTSDKRKTQFTIAVVDEGLLDITRFRTPDPWNYFYQKIRLDVKTWDIFSQIISANLGDVFKTFSIGGDMDYRESQLQPEKGKKRFKPVCLFQGPVETDNNGHATVKFDMPEYVGSVRVMVIGARQSSYARAEKTVPVKTELMTLSSLPRVIGPNETFTLPASIFAMEDNIGKVTTSVNVSGPIEVNGNNTAELDFPKAGDKDCYFSLTTKNATGQAEVILSSKSAKYQSRNVTHLMVRPSSPRIYKSFYDNIEPNQSIQVALPNDGIRGTNRATLTLAAYPGVNFGHRLKWLIQYPYGCIEQTTSAVLPQLYLKKFIEYPEANAENIDGNINIALENLRRFQRFSGEFAYWPYSDVNSTWGSVYAGHFMVEAKKQGYYVAEDMYTNWLNFTVREARNHSGILTTRCYRAYVLALAGKAPTQELNVLFEDELKKLDNVQKWLLAAAYKLSGNEDGIEKILKNADVTTKDYEEFSGTYGSGLRDKAIILDAVVTLGRYELADNLARIISQDLATTNWYSTQTTGYCLLALGKYIDYLQNNKDSYLLKGYVEYPGGDKVAFSSDKTVTLTINKNFGESLKVFVDQETTVKKVYSTLAWNGVPIKSTITDEEKNLHLEAEWKNESGGRIDVSQLKQGTSFYGYFTVTNRSQHPVDEIALVQILPSGWEIENMRLLDETLPAWVSKKQINREDYLDIRDDRIMWFFDLGIVDTEPYKPRTLAFLVKLNAVTVGEYDLPPTLVEAMYNGNYKATKAGARVKVTRE